MYKRQDDLLIYDEWTLHGADAVEECLEAAVYGASQRDECASTHSVYMAYARRKGALASLWWLTGWETWADVEVE